MAVSGVSEPRIAEFIGKTFLTGSILSRATKDIPTGRIVRREPILIFMNVQTKLLRGVDGNHLIMIVSGLVHINGVQLVLDRVIDASRQLLDCKVLLDFQDCTLRVLPSEFATLVKEFDFSGWPHNNKVVLVSTTRSEQYEQIAMLAKGLASNRIRIAAFPDIKEAVNWLSNAPQSCS